MKPKHQRLLWILSGLGALALSAFLVLNALRDHVLYFYTPAELAALSKSPASTFRLGGLVKEGSIKKEGLTVRFIVTDNEQEIEVLYEGVLPDLFREGQGVVAEGKLENKVFKATQVLAKHDEVYMPPEVEKSLKEKGYYRK